MMTRFCRLLIICLTLSSNCMADEFRAGAAAVDITPRQPVPLGGSYAVRFSQGILDRVYAKAIVIEQGGRKAAFVELDLSGTTRSSVQAARKLIAAQVGIPPQRVMISATHTHSAPVTTRDSVMDQVNGGATPQAVDFSATLPELIARAVAQADAKLAPAKSSVVIGREENLSFNRRFVLANGAYVWQGKHPPEAARPAGPIDPDVGIWRLSGKGAGAPTLATYVNFAMHPTALSGNLISPDYPGYLAKRLAEFLGADALTFFANGCCGNINQSDPHWTDQPRGPREGERIGTILAAAVFLAWPKLQPLETWPPRAQSVVLNLPRQKYTEEQLQSARNVLRRIPDKKLNIPTMAQAVRILDTAAKSTQPLEAEVQVVAVGKDLAIVALPGEIFVELGLALKKASPFKYTYIAELSNGSIGYVPNREAYPQGLYEVLSARGAPGSGEMLVQAALKMLSELAKP